MDPSVCILDKYFSILKNVGYLDDDSVTYIATYIALQELYNSWDWNAEYKKFIHTYINDLESNVCIISACTPCPTNNGKSLYYSNNGSPYLSEFGVTTINDGTIIKYIESVINNMNLLSVK